ncbi:MAG: efflux RND transporter periplasmic adaptor subunit [Desulfobacteraceae bacterium]|jgi:membrane fusion protein (multidrug efflux system)
MLKTRHSDHPKFRRVARPGFGFCLLLLAACSSPEQAGAPPANTPPPAVVVAPVATQTVPIYGEYVARSEARETVEIRSRVAGFLEKVLFEEGSRVKAGQLLFVIDQRPYQVALQAARGGLAQAEAALNKARMDVARLKPLVVEDAAPQMDLDNAESAVEFGQASIEKAKAAIADAELNLKFTEIRAPIGGIIGKQAVTLGNLVARDQTLLTTLSSRDPMRVVFSISEVDYLRVVQQPPQGNPFVPAENTAPFELLMADGSVYPQRGSLSFVDRALNPTTGTLNVYVSFPNPDGLLRPGLFGRVRVVLEERPGALLLPQRAVQVMQGVQMVLVVDKDDVVALRPVTTGGRYRDFFIVAEGLAAGERVVVEGLQRALPGRKVTPSQEPISQEKIEG